MSSLHIVLVQPQIPQNTGNIARTCAATGATLHLIEPLGFEITNAKLKRAGLDYWHLLDVHIYPNVEDFFERNHGHFYYFSTKAEAAHTAVSYSSPCYLLFGREDAGLPVSLLDAHPQRCVRIPMRESARSLNLSNSAAIAAFEVLRQWDYPF